MTLKTEHVLEVIGLAPAVFYAQLYAFPNPEEREQTLTGGVSLVQIQELVADALLELEVREAAKAEDEEPASDGEGGLGAATGERPAAVGGQWIPPSQVLGPDRALER